MGITLNQALTKYLSTISEKKAVNTQMLEKSASQRLLERIGAETPLGSISPQIVAKYRDARLQELRGGGLGQGVDRADDRARPRRAGSLPSPQ